MFADRQKGLRRDRGGDRLPDDPAWFRIGGVAHDLPQGWDRKVQEFLDWFPKRLDEYIKAAVENGILRARTIGVAQYNTAEAVEWGITAGGLRATGLGYDLRKARPYSGYENFESKCRPRSNGDALRPPLGTHRRAAPELPDHRTVPQEHARRPYKADHPLTCPPRQGTHAQESRRH